LTDGVPSRGWIPSENSDRDFPLSEDSSGE
jgi:hypothetical protein